MYFKDRVSLLGPFGACVIEKNFKDFQGAVRTLSKRYKTALNEW